MIKLKDLLSEGKFKMKGKYLNMPGGEVSSIPTYNERERIIVQIKNEQFKLYSNKPNMFRAVSNKNDVGFDGKDKLEKFLNKNKAKYIGIDRR